MLHLLAELRGCFHFLERELSTSESEPKLPGTLSIAPAKKRAKMH